MTIRIIDAKPDNWYASEIGGIYEVKPCIDDRFYEVDSGHTIEVIHTEPVQGISDPVNHPDHYTSGGVECIDAIKASLSEEAFKGFLKGNVLKYLWRYEKKAAPKQDLEKASWYLNKLIGEIE
mgnify:CR=1 FL=1